MSKKIAALKMSDEETLYHLLVKEHGYYRAILEITQLESEKLKYNYSNDEISPLLKKKMTLLNCIQENEQLMTPLKKAWQAKTEHSGSFSLQIDQELHLISKLLEEILQLDLTNQKILSNYLAFLKEQNLLNQQKDL